jgi:acyl phosphate:glycerol-3-phosphate acyltransferase
VASIGFTILGYLLGSIPFSVWLGKRILRTDIRGFGQDRNPGAANAWRAGKWRLGLPVLALDFLKGALPVALARWAFDISGWESLPVALAPVLGHAFSPFLKFKGGKAVAVTFGIWTGLLPGAGPLVLGASLALFLLLLASEAWAVIFGMFAFLGYLILAGATLVVLSIWTGNLLILAFTHRRELRHGLQVRLPRRSS